MPLKNADILAALKSGTAAKLSDGHSLYLVARNGRGSWVYEYRDEGKLRSKGLASVRGRRIGCRGAPRAGGFPR